MTAIIGIIILVSGSAAVIAVRRCPLARAVGFQIDQVASAKL